MTVYQICKNKFKKDLSGKGAELSGGRWNSKGVPMLYTSESIALCMLEVLVHIPKSSVPDDFVPVKIEIPDNAAISEVKINSLPNGWNEFPFTEETRNIGDDFIRQQANLLLKVPSSIVPDSFNMLLNPQHPEMKEVKIAGIQRSPFDVRLYS